ncbi:cytidine deaminase [Aurantiacibacter poecillastricola]|uniref:cytidine deaminase n=1 Tax=Aurantiacibacter poecillastricola TaxID=3064385 RepID=UPI00273D49E4|nr:cytidine deaminase [Aurantiacibacter sp. 219JJ12-13]MDP5263052.1 cytidine deaminase [Aurantiacibacter sp. 219JJ12-13]
MNNIETLIKAAMDAREQAHAPYSQFLVGCAVENADGALARGANMENACYRLGVCAEQSALAAAQIAFGLGNVARLAIVGGPLQAAEGTRGEPVMPCGGCRQAIMEAATLSGRDITIVCCDHTGQERVTTTIKALLPSSFTLPPA